MNNPSAKDVSKVFVSDIHVGRASPDRCADTLLELAASSSRFISMVGDIVEPNMQLPPDDIQSFMESKCDLRGAIISAISVIKEEAQPEQNGTK